MLGGIAPILIFNFYPEVGGATFKSLSSIPLIGGFVAKNIGVPIPLYLDQRLTGIQIDNETKALDAVTNVQNSFDPKTPTQYSQKGIQSLVSINMLAQKDSIALTVLLALNDMVFNRLVRQSYNVSYLNGPTTVFGALFKSFSATVGNDDDLFRIVFQIEKGDQNTQAPKATTIVAGQTSLTPQPLGIGGSAALPVK